MIADLLTVAAAAVVVGGTAFYLFAVAAVRRLRARPTPSSREPPPSISVLKPLAGRDLGLEENLSSFFALDFPDYELLFGVYTDDDPAKPFVERLIAAHPGIAARLLVVGEPPLDRFPNRKVFTLDRLAREASGEVLVVSDSDILVRPDSLRRIAADFTDPKVGVSTCPYRAAGGPSLWSELEALGMNTEFWGGVFVAEMLSPMDFAVGPTMAVGRECLEDLGGFEAYRDYLAEDFVIGRDAREHGWRVVLSAETVEHRIGSQDFVDNFKHRLRWYRSTRRSRPAGYLAQVFTYPLPFAAALALLVGAPWTWTALVGCLLVRAAAARSTAAFLGEQTRARFWTLLPLQDLLSFATWLGAFFGNRIVWRGREFLLARDGRLRPL